MGVTETTLIKLKKQAKSDTGWHTALNATLDMLDRFVGGSGYGDPNNDLIISGNTVRTKVTGEFVGQKWYRIDANVFYVCNAVGIPPIGNWVREIIRGATQPYLGDPGVIAASYPGWVFAAGQSVDLVYSDATVIETIVVPNARGRFMAFYDDTLGDQDYDTIAELGDGGGKMFTVTEDNIEEFSFTNGGIAVSVHQINPLPGVGVATLGADHTHTIGKAVGDLVELDNRPPYIVAGLLYKL